ncbi:2OG-Fe(II) oxygenase [Fluviispira multicolorata]|uniref:Fe2OG dioxygenase domain-containing protein n=1 Tax=Fluviispira multicolorata TaxID=2654512 RepID=A0A833JBD7_9BACT|nr:2OG-Fe(II) oxygenase [Fluviispira multicolorata]KAB8029207.1 hypothetical protein GCL57_11770 [Fluviispira multicolorata]
MDKLNMSPLSSILEGGFKEVAKSIYTAELISKNHCNDLLLEVCDSQLWYQAKIATAKKDNDGLNKIITIVDTNIRNANCIRLADLNLSDIPKSIQCLKHVQRIVGDFASSEFGLIFNEFGDAEVVRYSEGGMFKPHTDAHRENSHRAFTIIVYLNEDFIGGETYFPNLDYKCIPKSGLVLLFLSNELHSSLPIIEGKKNIIVFWGFYPGSIGRKNIKNFP